MESGILSVCSPESGMSMWLSVRTAEITCPEAQGQVKAYSVSDRSVDQVNH